jgi:hypothetical protein
MPIFFNMIGFGLVALGVLAGAFLGSAIGGNSTMLIAGLTMAAGDLIYRSQRRAAWENTSFFHPRRGGNIMFIPVWIVGAIVFVVGLIM